MTKKLPKSSIIFEEKERKAPRDREEQGKLNKDFSTIKRDFRGILSERKYPSFW